MGLNPSNPVPEKSEGYYLTRAQLRRTEYLKNMEANKIPNLTYNDFSKYYCEFDKEIENQPQKLKEVANFY